MAISPVKLRAWYSHRQGLDGSLEGKSPAAVLGLTGWARSVGGVGPYLTLHARAETLREEADRAVERLDIHELPAARNCTYVLPAEDFALGLTVGRSFWGGNFRTALKLGVTEKEIDKLSDAVVKALARGPLDPDEIRQSVGGAARSLGEEGKKKGVSTTLPLALGKLQTSGEIRRVSTNGRLDNQRYKYALWRPNPLAKFKLTQEEAMTELARHYFSWIGPERLSEFQRFSGLGVKASHAAIAPLKLASLDGEFLMLPKDVDAFDKFTLPKQAHYTLVSSLDGIGLLGPGLRGLLDPADMTRELFLEKDARPASTLDTPPSHAILDRGRVVGLWEFDTATNSIAWMPFIKKNKDLANAVARTEEYVRKELGDARSFSLDSPKSRAPRIEYIQKMAARG
jgi:Winged helix DNA-binding domain